MSTFHGTLKSEETHAKANELLYAAAKEVKIKAEARTRALEAQRAQPANTGSTLPPAPSTIAASHPTVTGTYSPIVGRNQTPAEIAEAKAGGANAGIEKAAGNVAGEVASTLFSDVEKAFGADLVKGLLYVLLAGGGAALIITGISRATGVHPAGAVKKAAGAAAVAAAV
jgi:hypothetical protein